MANSRKISKNDREDFLIVLSGIVGAVFAVLLNKTIESGISIWYQIGYSFLIGFVILLFVKVAKFIYFR